MVHPLAGVVEKLRNADFHLHRLAAEVRAYMDSGSNAGIISEHQTDKSGYGRLLFKVTNQPPLKIAAIAGDVVHNLRSSLDYIVEQLVKKEDKTPAFQHQFPISKDSSGFNAEVKKGRLYGIAPKGIWVVEQFQPYHVKPEAFPRHPLLHLHALSNRDKHHMLAISALNAQFAWKFVTKDQRVVRSGQTTEPVNDGGILIDEMPLEFLFDGEKAQLQSKLTISVGFSEIGYSGFDVAATLQNIREYIGLYMFPAFGTFFPPLPDDLRLTSHGITNPGQGVPMEILVRPGQDQ